MSDAHDVPERRRFEVALQGEGSRWSLWSPVELDHEPREGEEITLEDGVRAKVDEIRTSESGDHVIWARRLPSA